MQKNRKRFWFQVGVILTASTIAGLCLALLLINYFSPIAEFFKGLLMFLTAIVGFAVALACIILSVYFIFKFIGYAVGKGLESAKGK